MFFLRILNAPGSWFFHTSLVGPISMRRSWTASRAQSEGFGRAVYFLDISKVLNEVEKNKVPSQRKWTSRTRSVCVFILKVLLVQTCLRLFVCLLTYLCLLLSAQICEQSLCLIGNQACFTWCVCVWYFVLTVVVALCLVVVFLVVIFLIVFLRYYICYYI